MEYCSLSQQNVVSPKKPKITEGVSDISPCASLSLMNTPSVTSSPVLLSKGKYESGV